MVLFLLGQSQSHAKIACFQPECPNLTRLCTQCYKNRLMCYDRGGARRAWRVAMCLSHDRCKCEVSKNKMASGRPRNVLVLGVSGSGPLNVCVDAPVTVREIKNKLQCRRMVFNSLFSRPSTLINNLYLFLVCGVELIVGELWRCDAWGQ